jgi:hypothetical protein
MKRILLAVVCILIFTGGLFLFHKRPSATQPHPIPASSQTVSKQAPLAPLVSQPTAASNTVLPGMAAQASTMTNQPGTFAAFDRWARRYAAGDASANVTQGEALAWKRREAMRELIESDPAKAIELAVPFRWRRDLPANITRHFEQWIDGRGSYEVAMAEVTGKGKEVYRWAVIGGKRFDAYVYGRRSRESSRKDIPLHGVALDNKIALHAEPIRVLESDEAQSRDAKPQTRKVCKVCGKSIRYPGEGIAAEIGGEIGYFCSDEDLSLVNEQWKLAAYGGSGSTAQINAGGGSSWTQGRKTLLYLRVNFPDDLTEPISEANAYTAMDSVNAFYVKGSYDTTWITATVTPLLTLPQVKAWYSTAGPFSLLDDARETARMAGLDTDNYDLDIVAHTSVPDFDWGGLGFVGAKGTWLQSQGAGVTAHELGHNYGLMHANFWDTITNSGASVIGPGTNREYGNIFDTMGAASAGNNQFNAMFKNQLDWLPTASIHDITSNGIYRLYPFDLPQRINGRPYAAKVRKDFDRDYWMEFRQAFTGNPSLQNGVLLNWSPWMETGGSSLLDTTPETIDRSDAAVTIGRTFSDPLADVHITPVARSTVSTDPWIDVQVNIGTSANNWPPTLRIEIDPTNAAPGQLVHFHATASDLNGDTLAYAWSFDDATFSTNNEAWTSKSWPQGGEHVVRCVVSDMKGGIASANGFVTVGQPTGYRLSGLILDLNNDPIEGVRVDNGLSPENQSYIWSYTDSDGYFVIAGITNDPTLEATKYGYVFTNVNWQNPLQLTSNMLNANFRAVPLTNVSLTLSTNLLIEGSGGNGQLTLLRTGGTNDDLTVTLYVSGTAGIPGDLNFTPPLSMGSNSIVIPAGTNRVIFTFTPVNNAVVESTETLSATLFEDPNYIIAPLAEARITILDDDVPTLPAVSVQSANASVSENGTDNGIFVFSRTGPTTSSLPVYYSVGGTATASADYPTLVGVAVIPAGQSSTRVEFQPIDDKDVEADETVIVAINSNATYTGAGSSATTTITDDDLLIVSVAPTSTGAAEPSTAGRFTIKRDGDISANLVVYYALSGTAGSGADYIAPTGAATIPAGATSTDVTIVPVDDLLTEGDESVTITLTTNPGYDIGNAGSATLYIRDNEKASVSISAPTSFISEPGSGFGSFTVSRGSVANGNLTVSLAISGTATPGADYLPLDNFVVIPDGSSSVTIDVIPFDDLFLEPAEDVILTLAASTNYNIGSPNQASVVITDDDSSSVPAVGFTFAGSSGLESESRGISVSLSYTSAVPITVNYKVIGGTASNNDYTLAPGPLTFDPGERAKSIPLLINDDNVVEANETIRLTLYDPVNATHDGNKVHTYTIIDDDACSVSVSATANASEASATPGNFRIARTGGTASNQLVNFQISGTASAPSDFASLGTSAIIPAGAAFIDVPVTPVQDNVVELDQSVVMTLTSAPGANLISPNSATVLLTDDDPNGLPLVSISCTNKPYAVEGGGSAEFVFTRTGPTTNALTIYLAVTGTASSGSDYAGLPASINIPVGQTSFVLSVSPVDDALIEGDETVIAAVTVRDTYRVSFSGSAKAIIQDNDQNVRVDASDFESAEPGTDLGAFTFTRFGSTNTSLQVFFTISGTAGNGADYASIGSSFTIPAGSLSATLPITPLNDALVEGAETVTLTLQSNPAYTLTTPTAATVTILDDEPMFRIIARGTNVIEGSPEPAVFTVLRSGDPSYEVTARLAISGTATYGIDYLPFLTNVFFNCGVTSIDLSIYPTNELAIESAETVTAALIPNPAYTILSPSNAIVTIEDAATNRAPLVTITSPTTSPVFLLGTNVNLLLEANITDDGDTNTIITVGWTNVSGPDSLSFADAALTNTAVSFTNSGVYVLRLTADDGLLTNYAEVTVVVDTLGMLSSNILHWTFDEGVGTNVTDVSSNGHNGVVIGSAGWTTNGVLGGALQLNGTNNFVREATASALLNGLKQFSLSCWLNPGVTNSDLGIFTANETNASSLTLAARLAASCGANTNVMEAGVTTTRGETHRISANKAFSSGWNHIALTWSNGLPPSLYINGRLDQPGKGWTPLRGTLTNCPQFIVGKGPLDIPVTWKGLIDEVKLFPRALNPFEVNGFAATNFGPVVTVPTNIVVQVITPVDLSGTVTDDDRPVPPGFVSNTWVQVSGPLDVILTDPHALTNTVEFTQAGDYIFRLIADDGQVKVFSDLIVTVVEPTSISVYASDSEAAEMGPDAGEFTFTRVGDLNFDMTVQVVISGTASNGADYVVLPYTNSVTLSNGLESITIPVTPFLDHRTEGDESVTFTIVSNLAYTISSGEATVTIHDSPYGEWNIARFTLEELTDPNLSGEGADYDHDGRVNFVEYAFNREPKTVENTAPLTTAIEVNPSDNKNHITLTYQRRIEPTDVEYEVRISPDLFTWHSGTNYVEEIQATDDGNNLTQTVKARLVAPWSTGTNQFLTIRVWLQATGP